MAFEIMYKFVDDVQLHTCYVTYEQYLNFKKLPVVQECNIIQKNQEGFEDYLKEMQEAINLAVKNDTSHILKHRKMYD